MLDESVIRSTLDAALRTGGAFAEVFVEDRRSSTAVLDDGKVEELVSGHDRGAGIRVVVGDTTGFAHTADLTESGLAAAAQAAAAAARGGGGGVRAAALTRIDAPRPNTVLVLPGDVAKASKVALLTRADHAARGRGSISQVAARYMDSRRRILVANSDGVLAEDDQVKTLFSVSCVASGDTGMQTGRESVGRPVGFELFDATDVEELARAAANRALTKLRARPAPSGSMPVVVGPGGGGVMFHEACGHGLEADLVMKGASVYAGKQGQQVASPLVTLIDDGTMSGEWGCFAIDDEGRRAQRNVLIEDGVLTDYMWDLLRSRKEGRASSGNGRRQTYQHLPMVRMTNTYIANGTEDPESIIADTPRGVYVAQLGGGQVNTATGDFVFGMQEAYLIEDGRITEPIREGNLIGNGPQVLREIEVIGNDFAMGHPGTCGKDGQGVPVGDGTPTLRVRSLTIGGTAALSRTDLGTVDLERVSARIADQARTGEQIEALVTRERGTETRAYDGAIEFLTASESATVAVRVVVDGRQGFAWAGSLDDDVIAETLAEARDNAAFGTPDDCAGLAEPDGVVPPTLALFSDALASLRTEAKLDLALELERATSGGDPRIVGCESADYGDAIVEAAIATSTGIRTLARESVCWLTAYALAADGDDTTEGFGFAFGRSPDDLDVARAARDAVQRATRLLGATKPQSRRLTVVLEPWVTSQLLDIVGGTLAADAVIKGRSLFANRVGERVASPLVTFVDDPTDPAAFSASPTDDEGLASRRNVLVADGVLHGFLHNAYTARRSGTVSNASAVRSARSTPAVGIRAASLRPGTKGRDALVRDIDLGLLVQDVSGLHSGVNAVSGDFSTGAEGMMIRGGALAEPVRELTIASTIQKLLLDVVAVGDDTEWFPGSAAGVTLVIDDVTMSAG